MAPLVFKPLATGFAALAPLLLATAAWAAPEPSPSEISVARRLFGEARAAEDAGRWVEAAEKFKGAIAIKDTPGLRFHLARCEEEQGSLVEALVEYDRARELLDSGVKAADVEKLLAAARERVRAKVALLTLKLPQEVQNVSVELDGRALSRSVVGQPMPINPGKHHVNAVAVGRRSFTGDVELAIGEVKQLEVQLPESTTAPAPTAAPVAAAPSNAQPADVAPAPHASGVSTKTVLLVGESALLVAGLATGIGFLVARGAADTNYDQASASLGSDSHTCSSASPPPACAKLSEALDDRHRDSLGAVIGFAGAGVSAAALGLTYFLWPGGEAPADIHARASQNGWFVSVNANF